MGDTGMPVLGDVVGEVCDGVRPPLLLDSCAVAGRAPVEADRIELSDPIRGESVGAEAMVLAAVHHPRAKPHPVVTHVSIGDTSVPVFGDERHEVRDSVHPQLRGCPPGPSVRAGRGCRIRVHGLECYSHAAPLASCNRWEPSCGRAHLTL